MNDNHSPSRTPMPEAASAITTMHASSPNPSSAVATVDDPSRAACATTDLDAAERSALVSALADSPIAVLLDAAGHSPACIRRIRSGNRVGCSCKSLPQPLDDAATAIGLAIRFAQMGSKRRIAIPRGVVSGLAQQVDAGNAAAILVWQWLARRGQVPARPDARPTLRLVSERR